MARPGSKQGWTDAQKRCAITASGKAGFNDQQRYMAMLHAGCPKSASGQVSMSNPKNPHAAFEQFMAIAESAAAQRGQHIYPPKGKRSWAEVADSNRSRQIKLIESIWDEARHHLGAKFHADGLDGFVQRMTSKDTTAFGNPLPPRTLEQCDAAQVYRILEGLKGWVGREFSERGIEPGSFTLHWHDRKRLEEIQKRIA